MRWSGFWRSWFLLAALAVPVFCMLLVPFRPGRSGSFLSDGAWEGGEAAAGSGMLSKGGDGRAAGDLALGRGAGESGRAARMEDYLEPGDVLLGRCRVSLVPSMNPPGGWTHAALYVGDGEMVVAANPYQGTVRTLVGSWEYPRMTWVVCLRVTAATAEERRLAARLAEEEVGTSYDLNWFAEQEDGDTWYCSELIWGVYHRATGGRLDLERGWGTFGVSPDDIYLHPGTEVIGGHFERRPDTALSLLAEVLALCALFGVAAVVRF